MYLCEECGEKVIEMGDHCIFIDAANTINAYSDDKQVERVEFLCVNCMHKHDLSDFDVQELVEEPKFGYPTVWTTLPKDGTVLIVKEDDD